MYSKTNPRAGSLTTRQKRVFAIISAGFVLLLCGFGVWGVLAHDNYGASGHGCVNVNIPNSTGGATLHYCGSRARSFCETVFKSTDQISMRARPQCVLAGLGPSTPATPSS